MPVLKKLLVNHYETTTDNILQEAVKQWSARVCPKVRIADIVDIDKCHLTSKEYTYALKAHVDFLVVDEDSLPLFAIEFDGNKHETDSHTKANDVMKEKICLFANLPLLRINSRHLKSPHSASLLGQFWDLWPRYNEIVFYAIS